jgi:hypothetical protein
MGKMDVITPMLVMSRPSAGVATIAGAVNVSELRVR